MPVPGPPLQLTLVAVLASLVVLLLQGRVREDRVRLQLYVAGALAVTLAAALATWRGGPLSLPSWAVLLALWLPWAYRLRDPDPAGYRHLATVFVRLMLVLAAVGTGQVVAQLLGVWTYTDVLEQSLPAALLIEGYNTSIPVEYGAAVHKANAFVFLEPSFFSQYCALAMVVGLVLGVRVWQLVVLGVGLAAAVSGTGPLLLAVGVLLTLLRRPSALRPAVVAPALVGFAVLMATPVAELLLERRDEFTRSGSSGNSRFVAPYPEVAEGLAQDPVRYLVGAGPGTVTRLLESSARGQLGDAIVYNIPSKLVFEYGLVAGAVFTAFIVVALLHRGPSVVVPGTVLFMLFILSGSLLQPHTAVLAWLLTGLWSGATPAGPPGRAGREPRRDRGGAPVLPPVTASLRDASGPA